MQTPLSTPMAESQFMEEHISYHGPITQDDAVKRLKKSGINCYLTRYSTSLGMYVITAYRKKPETVGNFGLIVNLRSETDRYRIFKMERKFMNIDEMLRFYETNRIHPTFANIGRRYTQQDHIDNNPGPCTIL